MKELSYTTERMVCYFANVIVQMTKWFSVMLVHLLISLNMSEKFEDTEEIFRSRDSKKDRQYNGQ